MQNEVKDPSGVPQDASSIESENQNGVSDTNQSVKYETYRRTLSQAKKFKEEAESLQNRLIELEQGKLEAEGEKDKLIDSLRRQNQDLEGKYKGAVGSFATSRGMSAIVSEAVQAGCTQTRLLEKLIQDKLEVLDFDDSFNPDPEQVKMIVEEARKEAPVLFSKAGPNVPSHTMPPSTAGLGASVNKALKSTKDDDLMKLWEQAHLREK